MRTYQRFAKEAWLLLLATAVACESDRIANADPKPFLRGGILSGPLRDEEYEDPPSAPAINWVVGFSLAWNTPDNFTMTATGGTFVTGGVAAVSNIMEGVLRRPGSSATFKVPCAGANSCSDAITFGEIYCNSGYYTMSTISKHRARWLTVGVDPFETGATDECGTPSGGGFVLTAGGSYTDEECYFCQQYFWYENGVAVDEWWECTQIDWVFCAAS